MVAALLLRFAPMLLRSGAARGVMRNAGKMSKAKGLVGQGGKEAASLGAQGAVQTGQSKSDMDSMKQTLEKVEKKQEESAQTMAGPKKSMFNPKNLAAGVTAGLGAVTLTSFLTPRFTMGLAIIIFSIFIDLLNLVILLQTGDVNSTFFLHVFCGLLIFYFVHDGNGKRDPLALVFLFLKVFPIFFSWVFTSTLAGSVIAVFIANTISNPFLPLWSFYTSFLKNPQNSKVATLLFILWIVAFFAVGWTLGKPLIGNVAGIVDIDDKANAIEGQKESFMGSVRTLIDSVRTAVTDFIDYIFSLPEAVAEFIDNIINPPPPGSDQPEYGLRITDGEYDQLSKSKKQFRAALNTKETAGLNNFLEVTDVECVDEETGAWAKGREFLQASLKGENIKVYSLYPQPVTCSFFNEDEMATCSNSEVLDRNNLKSDQAALNALDNLGIELGILCLPEEEFEELESVELRVDYDSDTSQTLNSYIMKKDLKEELLGSGQDPLDFIFTQGMGGFFKPGFAAESGGPARLYLGSVELLKPPLSVSDDPEQPYLQLRISNNPAFKGHITKVKDIWLKLPKGFSLDLEDESCPFVQVKGTQEYITDSKRIKEQGVLFSAIKSKPQSVVCPLNIDADDALGGAPFAQVIFEATANFVYRTKSTIQ